jgi:SPP1 family predicted phage head-tail adaptor
MPASPYNANSLVIAAGELRHSIQVQKPRMAEPDTFGSSVVPANWDTVRTCFARIYTAGGRETNQAAQIVSEVSHVVKTRWKSTVIKAGYRVVFGNRIMTVQYVENVEERDRVLLLYCLEVNGGGE